MRSQITFIVFLFSAIGVWGQTPISTPVLPPTQTPAILTLAPEASAAPKGAFTPVPGEKFKLEDWVVNSAPVSVKPEERRTKPGVWMSTISLGAGIPQTPNLQQAYNTALHFGLGTGLRVSASLSFWLDFSLDQFNNKNADLTNHNNYMVVGLAGLAHYRFLASDFSPFVFGGPGLAYNENRTTVPVVDTTYNTVTLPISGDEFDFLMEGGLGAGYEAVAGLEFFIQGRLLWDLTSSNFAGIAYTDSPVKLIPLEAGAIFSY